MKLVNVLLIYIIYGRIKLADTEKKELRIQTKRDITSQKLKLVELKVAHTILAKIVG